MPDPNPLHIHGPGCGHHQHDAGPAGGVMVDLPDDSANPILIRVTRGGLVESTHRGRAVVVGADGHVLAAFGDVKAITYPRSANKALQALPLVETGAADAFGLETAELALACSSHDGEPMHTERVAAWLSRIGLSPAHLECGSHAPYSVPTWEAMLRRGEAPTTLHNNCSGKHTGMLTTALHRGEAIRGYVNYQHRVQQRILGVMEQVTAHDLTSAPWGTDGCSIPTIGLPLEALAFGMARMADPQDLPSARADAAQRLLAAWGAHPELVSGTEGFDTLFMQALNSRILSKAGAEGVSVGIIPDEGIAIAVKIDDGAKRAAGPAMAAVLRRLGLLTDPEWAALEGLVQPAIRNRAGLKVGGIEAGF
ncbi:asparaginase [Niveispirillum sp. KHB5.9]|uniref:asparaginase n=1 Tax=Niveispirillum sp. KHB5.9 TaxID=3400269 RepID=UPI003A86C99A